MSEERVEISGDDDDNYINVGDGGGGGGAGVIVYGPAAKVEVEDAWPERLADLLRAGLAAEEAPEGLWPGPVVEGRQTYYCDSTETPNGWDRRWSSYHDWDDEDPMTVRIVQCRPPAPQPATEDVPLAHVTGRSVLDGSEVGSVRCRGHAGWQFERPVGKVHADWCPLPVNPDGTVTVIAESGAS